MKTHKPLYALIFALIAGLLVPASAAPQQQGQPKAIGLPDKENNADIYLYQKVNLPAGKIIRAWTAISAYREFVLYINGKEACRSRYGRVPSIFRSAEEIENLGKFFHGGANTLVMKVRRWSLASKGQPCVRLEAEVQVQTPDGLQAVPIQTDETWVGSYDAPANWKSAGFAPKGWQPVTVTRAGRLGPRIRRDQKELIWPDVPPPMPAAASKALPQITKMSDWSQQVVTRDTNKDIERLMQVFHTRSVAEWYAKAIRRGNTRMGDTFSITGYPVGNGLVFTTIGPWPFYNSTCTLGPEYQYPVQWNPGSTFAGDAVRLSIDGKGVNLNDQWMWKIRRTDVVVAAASDPKREVVFYALTLAPPDLKAMIRIYMVVNNSDTPLKNVQLRNEVHRTKVIGKTLRATVAHGAMKDAAGQANKRTMITGVLDESAVTTATRYVSRKDRKIPVAGALIIPFGDLEPGQAARHMVYHVTYLNSIDGKPVPSDAEATLAKIRSRGYKMLDDTIAYWRKYNSETTTLKAPGKWGRRVEDYIDDVKMLVQVQQFKRTGAIGPMWFFSDQWIRDACGPVKSFLRTGKFENARRVLAYHYLSAIACRKILNWLPMDVKIDGDYPPVEDWSKITMNHADRHANCEVASWIVLKHHWYFRATGDTKTIERHWEYIKRAFYGQFDNDHDKIHRPDFKIPFHGDETYIYSGGEGLWPNRYDLKQNCYPGGNIYSADSSFELVAAGDALVEMGKAIGKTEDVAKIAAITKKIRAATEKYYWMADLGMYAQGMSVTFDGQLNRYPMGNILANVIWSGYGKPTDPKTVSNTERMMEYLMEDSGVLNPIVGYDVTVGMLQGQGLYAVSAIKHPWAEKAFYALLMISGDTTEYSEWMAPGADFRTMYRANRIRPWEAGINLDASLFYLTGMQPDAFKKKLTLTPRLPTGVYSPIKWDSMTVGHLTMGQGHFDLEVRDADTPNKSNRTYTITSHSKDDVEVTLNVLLPFAEIQKVTVNGRSANVKAREVYRQALAPVTAKLPAGKKLTIRAFYKRKAVKPVQVDLKPFRPTQIKYDKSDIVVFASLSRKPKVKLLIEELSKDYNVLAIDATLPTDPASFAALLLDGDGIRTKVLAFTEGTMAIQRKTSFWWDSRFNDVIGKFIKRGGVVMELNSGNRSSKWLAGTLGGATYSVNYARGGKALAMDKADKKLDKTFYWLDEKQAHACGKWAGYWAGRYTKKYIGEESAITDSVLIWGEQELSHGCMQYTMKTTPGKDHLIRIRSWTTPYKMGFTLQVQDKALAALEGKGQGWKVIQTVCVPILKDPKKVSDWVDVYLTLPKKYVTAKQTVFRIGCPKGSFGGIGAAPERLASTGAARIWIRDDLNKPPSVANMPTSSELAAKLGMPSKGVVGQAGGRIAFKGFVAPYRILGDSTKAVILLKPIGKGLYIKSEMTSLFPVKYTLKLIDTVIDSSARSKAVAGLKIAD